MGQQTRRSRSNHGSLAHFCHECRAQHMPMHHCRARQPLNRRTTRHQLLSPHVCEHTHDTPDQARVSIMTACSDAWLKVNMVGGGAKGVQREQRAHRRARFPLLPQPCPSDTHRVVAEGSTAARRLQRFRSRLGVCIGQLAQLMHTHVGFNMPCEAEAWREPSRAVCSLSRKSKPRHGAMFFCRCNASRRCHQGCSRRPQSRLGSCRDA